MPVREIDDDAFEWIVDHRGRPAKIVKAGVTYRVPMMARDSLSPVQQAIIADKQRVVDGAGDAGFALNRPGSRMLADRSAYDECATAYQEMVERAERAWIDGPAHLAPERTPPDTAGTAPAWRDGLSIVDAERIKAEAREAAALDQASAWRRGPGA
jgi:hypothetical protein